MRLHLVVVAVLAFVIGALAHANSPFQFPAPKKFSVGSAKPAHIPRGTSVSGGTYTITRGTTCINADGSQSIGLIYANALGQIVSAKTVLIDSACTKAIDNAGNVVSSTGPTTECSAAVTFTGQEDATIGSAASGGKLPL